MPNLPIGFGDLDKLNQVKLKSFTATPTRIGPFGASVLSWEVTGPTGEFGVELGGTQVPPLSFRPVRPAVTSRYRLSGRVGSSEKPLTKSRSKLISPPA
jgi:hypothetical protein